MNKINSHRTLIQYLWISILITASSGSSFFSKCISEGSRESKLLLYGRPPRCFPAGLQGPCSTHEVLLPRSETSHDGVCEVKSTDSKISPPSTHIKKRDINDDEYYDGDDDTSQQLTKMFMRTRCQLRREMYSVRLRRCILKRPANFYQDVLW